MHKFDFLFMLFFFFSKIDMKYDTIRIDYNK